MNKANKNIKLPQQRILTSLQINTLVWEKDSHGLFDYQSSSLILKKFKIEGSCKLFRNAQTEIQVINNQDIKKYKLPSQGFKFVSSINVDRTANQVSYVMSKPLNNTGIQFKAQVNHDIYFIVRSLKNEQQIQKGLQLNVGDVIRLGRQQYLVLEYRDQRKVYSLGESSHLSDLNLKYYINTKKLLNGTCKFCLNEEFTEENCFISPCKCKGSCEVVHINCLKLWIDSKIKKQPNGIATQYNFTKFQCQLCKTPFPQKIVKDGHEIQMIKIQKPNKPYIIMESLSEHKNGQNILYCIITPLQNNKIKLGRGHQCEIRMKDISVSRLHAHIKFEGNRFIIFDNGSKFGTLVKMQTPLLFGQDQIALQIGRTVLSFQNKLESNNQLKSNNSNKQSLGHNKM